MTVALLEALNRLSAQWEKTAGELDEMADRSAARGALPERTATLSYRAQALQDCAEALRTVLTQGTP